MSVHAAPWTSEFLHQSHVVISYRQHNLPNTGQEMGLLWSPPMSHPVQASSGCPTELRGFSQACILNRVQAFWRLQKNSLCLTCTKLKCNALLKQDSIIKTTAKHYLQPKTHFVTWTQAQRKYCSSTSLLSFKNLDIFGSDALFPLFK